MTLKELEILRDEAQAKADSLVENLVPTCTPLPEIPPLPSPISETKLYAEEYIQENEHFVSLPVLQERIERDEKSPVEFRVYAIRDADGYGFSCTELSLEAICFVPNTLYEEELEAYPNLLQSWLLKIEKQVERHEERMRYKLELTRNAYRKAYTDVHGKPPPGI